MLCNFYNQQQLGHQFLIGNKTGVVSKQGASRVFQEQLGGTMTWIPPPAGASGWSAKSDEGGRIRSHVFLNGIHMEITNIAMELRDIKSEFHNLLKPLVMTNIPIENSQL